MKQKKILLKPKDVHQKIFHKIPWNFVKASYEISQLSYIFHGMDKNFELIGKCTDPPDW